MEPGHLTSRITAAPVPFDRDRAGAVVAGLAGELRSGAMGALLLGTAGSSAYLGRLIERHGGWLAEIAGEAPEQTMRGLLAALDADTTDSRALGALLRQIKSRAALIIALADLGGVWNLTQVTGALTDLADGALQAACGWLLRAEIGRGRLPGLGEDDLAGGAGYAVLAMGKQGARELNYSSDIDLICLFDQDRFESADFAEAKARYIHVTRQVVRLLSETPAEGYVFRTDLRLRPSTSTTPVCMAME